jgi:hypothetical protein
MAERGTFEKVVAEAGQALLPLREALRTPDAFLGLLTQLGWHADAVPQPLLDLSSGVETVYDGLRRLLGDGGINVEGTVGDPDTTPAASFSADEVARVLAAVRDVITQIRAIADAPDPAIPAPLRADRFPELFPRQLLDHLIITYLQRFHPTLGFALRMLGVVKTGYVPAAGNRPSYQRLDLDPADLAQVLSDPPAVLRNAFGWGIPSFDFDALSSQVDNVLMAIGLDVHMERVSIAAAGVVRGDPADPAGPPADALTAIIFERIRSASRMTAAVKLLPVPADGLGHAPGLALLPSFDGIVGFAFDLGSGITVAIRSALDLQGGVALLARPGVPVEMVTGFESDQVPTHVAGAIEVVVTDAAPDREPMMILGSRDGTRLQFRSIEGIGGVRLVGDDVDIFAEIDLRGLEFVFRPDDADSFIAAVVPTDGFTVGADLTLGVSHRSGFYFRGTSGLEIQLPVRQQLGPVEIQGLSVSATPTAGVVPVALGVSFTARLGPVTAVVDRIGLQAAFAGRPAQDGNLGPIDVSLGFKPPTGVGLSIDAGGISGGGFLAFDSERGEYAGALDLQFADFLALKAIGLITTRMPDGSSGFSLLIVLTADFGSGIQLGEGFTLLAVGGLIGLHRGINLQALVEGVQTGAIESVAFPRDVIANAPRILSDLNRFFPPEQGTFLIGPMAKIGWGTPTLVSISLGVIIEIPGNIAVLGVLRAVLPTADEPLLVIQAQFIGALEQDKSRLWFFAKLFDSRIMTTTIDGGVGVLVAWGDNPDRILTVGGFHPAYRPPPLPFPIPDRLSMDLLNRPGQLLRVSGYFAITSNTLQFGANVELRLGFSEFGIQGHLGFDALFQSSPFRFAIHIGASLTLKAFGIGVYPIDLDFQLEGPAPYRAHGRGSIGFLFFSIPADFDLTWSDPILTTLVPILVLPLLTTEVNKIESWSARLPSGGSRTLVNLRQLPDTGELVLHPLGTLFVRQRAVPLDVRLDQVGGQRASDGRRFSLTLAPDSGLTPVSVTGDKFAMAQFQTMSDAAKLSRPSYETQDAGLELTAAAGALASARVVRRSARYELHIIDSGTATSPAARRRQIAMSGAATVTTTKRFHNVNGAVFDELLRGSSTSRAPLSQRRAQQRQPFVTADTVRVAEQRFVVAYVKSNRQAFPPSALGRPSRGAAATFRSRTTAADALTDFVTADPGLAGLLHVIPASEATTSPAVPGTWSDAGVLPAASSDVDLVPLATGKVLIAGGTDPTGAPLAATALFDPTADAWSASAPLTVARRRHTTTRLADGRVLALGGLGAGGHVLAAAETFDPAAATWTPVRAPMGTARYGHSATRLSDGRVLIAGGSGVRVGQEDGALASAELYDPAVGAWTAAAPMTDARTGHQAVLLRDGRVLVVGGALATGGGRQSALAYCELYDPTTSTWTPTGSLGQARKGHQATPLPDGRVVVTGGDAVVAPEGTLDPQSLATAELYDPASGAWTAAAAMPGGGRTGHRSLSLRSGVVLVIGGTGMPELTAGYRCVLSYHPAGDVWTTVGGLALGRFALGAVELADDRVLVGGGVAAAGTAAASLDAVQPAGTGEVLIP